MKAIIPTKLTNNQFRALQGEISRQCVEKVGQYEVFTDAAFLFAVSQIYGTERLKEIYERVYADRAKFKEKFAEGISEIAPFLELQKQGIDVAKMHDEFGSKYSVTLNGKK